MSLRCRGRVLLVASALLLLVAVPRSEQRGGGGQVERSIAPRRGSPALTCGTLGSLDGRGVDGITAALSPAVVDGEPLSFEQDPVMLFPDYTGTIWLRNVLVAGDVPTVKFKRPDTGTTGATDTWNRSSTRTIGGRTVSVFEQSWPTSDFAKILQSYYHGFDYPELYWGTILLQGSDDPNKGRAVTLRMSSRTIPASRVIMLDSTVQYASNVVNLLIPTFGDARVTQSADIFDEVTIANKFYSRFADGYDSLAIIPQAAMLPGFSGAHGNVRNDVSGIGLPLIDQSAQFGSRGALRSIEVYPGSEFATNQTSDHEITHQWGDYFNWMTIAGITPAGHEPASHSPLWALGETMIGAVLFGARRVHQMADLSYQIEVTPFPVKEHQIELYAMGKLPAAQVQPFVVFENQGQFSPDTASLPKAGVTVTGQTKNVTIHDIVAHHGARSGPSPTVWRRATIVISRDALLSQPEMDYWNFYAQRIEDPEKKGAVSVDGFMSFDRTIASSPIDLQTDITPKSSEKISQSLGVSFPSFSTREFPGIEFDQPVPSFVDAGQAVHLSGRVTAPDRTDFSGIAFIFSHLDQSAADAVQAFSDVDRSGGFSTDFVFTGSQAGLYLFGFALFWPNSGPQSVRSHLSPFIVN